MPAGRSFFGNERRVAGIARSRLHGRGGGRHCPRCCPPVDRVPPRAWRPPSQYPSTDAGAIRVNGHGWVLIVGRLSGFGYREVSAKLRRTGFVFDRTAKGSHEIWFNPTTRQRTTVPNHPGDLPERTPRAILKQAGIEVDVFCAYREGFMVFCSRGR